MSMNKGGQSAGVVTALVFGIAALIIGTIIAFTIISALGDANLLESGRTTTTVTNETTASITNATYELADFDANRYLSPSITTARNGTDGTVITSPNYTLDTTTWLLSNSTAIEWPVVHLDYTYTVRTNEELSSTAMRTNMSAGVNNVSDKIPTVLLIAAIVLILGMLAVLVGVWQRMRMGGGSL